MTLIQSKNVSLNFLNAASIGTVCVLLFRNPAFSSFLLKDFIDWKIHDFYSSSTNHSVPHFARQRFNLLTWYFEGLCYCLFAWDNSVIGFCWGSPQNNRAVDQSIGLSAEQLSPHSAESSWNKWLNIDWLTRYRLDKRRTDNDSELNFDVDGFYLSE